MPDGGWTDMSVGEKKSFGEWMVEVNLALIDTCGLGYMDLPDKAYRDEFDSGTTPEDMAYLALEDEGFDFSE